MKPTRGSLQHTGTILSEACQRRLLGIQRNFMSNATVSTQTEHTGRRLLMSSVRFGSTGSRQWLFMQ